MDADGDPTDPTTPDTELSGDGGSFADCAEEVSTITGSNGMGYLTLSGAEMDYSMIALAAKVASGPKATLATLYPRNLPILSSGTLSAGSAGGGTLGTILPYDITNCFIRTTGGTGGGGTGGANNQARRIATYTVSTGAFTVEPNWETTPDNTTTYDILLPEGISINMLKTLNPTTAGRTLDVSSGGEAGVDWANVGSPTTTLNLSGTAVGGIAGTLTTFDALWTKIKKWLQLLIRNDSAIATDNATELGEINADGGSGAGTYDNTGESLQAHADSLAAYSASLAVQINDLIYSSVIHETTVSSATSNTVFQLTGGSAIDDIYNDHFVTLVQVGTPTNRMVGRITAYTGVTKEVTLHTDPGLYTVSAGDTVYILSRKVTMVADSIGGQGQADIEAVVDGLIQSYRLHELLTAALSGAPTAGSLFGDLTEDDGGTQRFTANALEQAPTGGGGSSPELLVTTTITGLISNQLFQLTAGSSDDNAYNGCLVVIEDASNSNQKCVAVALAYSGATKTLSLLNDPAIFTIANGDTISIIADRSVHPDIDNTTLDIDPSSGNVGIDWGNIVNKTTTNDLTGTTVLADVTKVSGDSTAADKLEAWLDAMSTGTAQAGDVDEITLAAGAASTVNFHKNSIIVLYGGTGAGQARLCSQYVGSTKVATVYPNWATVPDNTTLYLTLPIGMLTQQAIRDAMILAPTPLTPDSGSIDDILADILALIGASAIGDAAWDEVIEGTLTARQMLRAMAGVLAGKVSGGGTTNPVFRNMSDTKDVVSSTVDASGNRTAQTYDLS